MSAREFLPERRDLPRLREAAAHCRGCPLYRRASRTVFGDGPATARLMLVGEQPGDQEDLQGHPFVGPAGQVLGDALAAAGLDRGELYLTNVVKHFKWEPRGRRRLHKRPAQAEVAACLPWLQAELEAVRPRVLVCLGVTAASAAFGRPVRLGDCRGRFLASELAETTFVTTHPSALLRLRGKGGWDAEFGRLVEDFERVAERLRPA